MKTILAAVVSLMTAIAVQAQDAYTVKVNRVIEVGYGAGLEVIGTIRNNTDTPFKGAIITVTLYDARNEILGTAMGQVQNVNGVLPGQTAVWTALTGAGTVHASQVKSALAVPSMVD